MDLDLSNSVVLPTEEYHELQAAAQTPSTLKQGLSQAVVTTAVMFGISAAASVGMLGWVKAVDWLETRRLARASVQAEQKPLNTVK